MIGFVVIINITATTKVSRRSSFYMLLQKWIKFAACLFGLNKTYLSSDILVKILNSVP